MVDFDFLYKRVFEYFGLKIKSEPVKKIKNAPRKVKTQSKNPELKLKKGHPNLKK